ncbi:unnamed protein product [Bursaphelenchus xylophilus]|uniref:(pine wood nematode) hypothetical protein n=1 Tax=Bursaphelenchus xylophilus TaxID=6326 RepID=A0A1I7S5X8_BURXY|nr:unnamed protein product [Bursaphelenchus xylophilus]CAG9082557.1 unnamed protein product [Bursaphelenchus xylophilus]
MAGTSKEMTVVGENEELEDHPIDRLIDLATENPKLGAVELCLLQSNCLKEFPTDFGEESEGYQDAYGEVQKLFIQVSNLKVAADPAVQCKINSDVYYWLFLIKRLVPQIFEKNQKSLTKIIRLTLDGLVFQLAHEEYDDFERCAVVVTHILRDLEPYAKSAAIFLAIHNIVSSKKKKAKQVYFEWAKDAPQSTSILILEVLWKLHDLGLEAWKTRQEIDILDVGRLMRFSFEAKRDRILDICQENLIKILKKSSFDCFIYLRDLFYRLGLPSKHPFSLAVSAVILRKWACFEPMEPLGREIINTVIDGKEEVVEVYYEILFEFLRDSHRCIDEEKLKKILDHLCKNIDETISHPWRFKLFNLFFTLRDTQIPVPASFAINSVLPRYDEFKKDPALGPLFIQLKHLCHLVLQQRERLLQVAGSKFKGKSKAQKALTALKPGLGSLLSSTYIEDKKKEQQKEGEQSEEPESSKVEELFKGIKVDEEVVLSSDEEEVKVLEVKRKKISSGIEVIGEKKPKVAIVDDLNKILVHQEEDAKIEENSEVPIEIDGDEEEIYVEEEDDDEVVTFLDMEMPKRRAKEIFQTTFGTTEVIPGRLKVRLDPLKPKEIEDGTTNVMENRSNPQLEKRIRDIFDPVNSEREIAKVANELNIREEDLTGDYNIGEEDPEFIKETANQIAEMFKQQMGFK